MSSGTGFGGFGHRGRTATVASAIEVGRMFLRDIFAAPRIVAEAAAELANPAHARTRQRSSLTLPTAALGNPDHAISSTARTVRISRPMRLPATGSTLSERSHPPTQTANATPASVWQDQVPMPANRSSRSPLARRITPSRQPLARVGAWRGHEENATPAAQTAQRPMRSTRAPSIAPGEERTWTASNPSCGRDASESVSQRC